MMLLIIGFNLTVYKYIQQCYVLIIVIISILIKVLKVKVITFKFINNNPPPNWTNLNFLCLTVMALVSRSYFDDNTFLQLCLHMSYDN